jgi:chromate transport protein ChrA
MKEFALNWVADIENSGAAVNEVLNVAAVSQYGGYAQGMTLAAYLGTKTPLGIFGGILGVIAFILPSVLIVIIILKIGERLYKNNIFKHSINYITLLAAGLICMIVWNYAIAIFFRIDLMVYPLIAALACFANIYFKINPVIIVLAGGLIGLIWRA